MLLAVINVLSILLVIRVLLMAYEAVRARNWESLAHASLILVAIGVLGFGLDQVLAG